MVITTFSSKCHITLLTEQFYTVMVTINMNISLKFENDTTVRISYDTTINYE